MAYAITPWDPPSRSQLARHFIGLRWGFLAAIRLGILVLALVLRAALIQHGTENKQIYSTCYCENERNYNAEPEEYGQTPWKSMGTTVPYPKLIVRYHQEC